MVRGFVIRFLRLTREPHLESCPATSRDTRTSRITIVEPEVSQKYDLKHADKRRRSDSIRRKPEEI